MSVRKNDRRLSDIEYENNLSKLKKYVLNKIEHCPVRYRHLFSYPINEVTMSIYDNVMKMTNLYNRNEVYSVNRYRACAGALFSFEELIKHSYAFINVSQRRDVGIHFVKDKQREFWADSINSEIKLIYGVMQKCRKDNTTDVVVPEMKKCSNYMIKNTVFLNKLAELQQTLYKSAARASKTFLDPSLYLLLKLSRDAFYHAVEANSIIDFPNNEAAFKKRRGHLNAAIDSLFNMGRPVYELWPSGAFNDEEIRIISSLSEEVVKILKTIKDSDAEVFRNRNK